MSASVLSEPLAASHDVVLRAMTNDGAFRAIVASTTSTVAEAAAAQGVLGEAARVFGELMTGTILVRETMAPQQRVQGIAKGRGGRGSLVCDSRPTGTSRGLVQLGKRPDGSAEPFALGDGARLQVMRSLHNGALHQGIVDVSGMRGMSEALTYYMHESEQVVCVLAVGVCLGEGGRVVRAGGYVVQLLPEVDRGGLMVMEQRLRDLPAIEALLVEHEGVDALMGELFHAMPFTELGRSSLRFECGCSLERVLTTLATLGRADVEELVSAGEVLEISCDYCGAEYHVPPERLRGLLETQ
jgi:molecular chaperone Hsp33